MAKLTSLSRSWTFPVVGFLLFSAFLLGALLPADDPSLLLVRDVSMALAGAIFLAVSLTLFFRARACDAQLVTCSRRLGEREEEVAERNRRLNDVKADMDLILGTVDHGLFLINSKYQIQEQYSSSLGRILGIAEPAGCNFLNVLETLVPERTFGSARDYLAILFDKWKKEREVAKLNPLETVEVNSSASDAGALAFLTFSFRRVVENGEIVRVFVSVDDVTQRVLLERRLAESEQRRERQCEFLLWVLHLEPRQLEGFLRVAQERAQAMAQALAMRDIACLDAFLNEIRGLKIVAESLRLQYFQKWCARLEERSAQIQAVGECRHSDLAALAQEQAALQRDLAEIKELRDKFPGTACWTSLKSEMTPTNEQENVAHEISALAAQLAQKYGKDVCLDADGFDMRGLSGTQRRLVKNVLIQLTKNGVIHGIEEARLREIIGKPRAGALTIRRLTCKKGNSFSFSFRDDGRGLDPIALREKAVAQGLISHELSESMTQAEAAGLIFHSGFSTSEEMTFDSGWGVGMSVVKEAIVDRCGGEIFVNSELGCFTEFAIVIPLEPHAVMGRFPTEEQGEFRLWAS